MPEGLIKFNQKIALPEISVETFEGSPNRVTRDNIDDMLANMRDYLLTKKKTYSLAPDTIYNREGFIKSLHNKTGGIVFSDAWVKMARGILEVQEKRPKTTVRDYLYAVEDFFNANGHPIKIAKPRCTEVAEVKWYPEKDIHKIMRDGPNGIRDAAILSTLYYAGLRNKECTSLWVDDLRIKDRKIMVRDHGQGIKNYQERAVPLPTKAMPILEQYLEVHASNIDRLVDPRVLFPSTETGAALTRNGLIRLMHRCGKRAGYPELHPHALRHSRCTYLANHPTNPVPVPQLQRMFGHKSIETTMRYLHSTYEQLEKSISKLDN